MTKVINTRRATWICAKCKRDVSLQYLLWYQAAHPEEWGNAGGIVHSDGNIFFTNIGKLNAAIKQGGQ